MSSSTRVCFVMVVVVVVVVLVVTGTCACVFGNIVGWSTSHVKLKLTS
jgi:hypothetical protein